MMLTSVATQLSAAPEVLPVYEDLKGYYTFHYTYSSFTFQSFACFVVFFFKVDDVRSSQENSKTH